MEAALIWRTKCAIMKLFTFLPSLHKASPRISPVGDGKNTVSRHEDEKAEAPAGVDDRRDQTKMRRWGPVGGMRDNTRTFHWGLSSQPLIQEIALTFLSFFPHKF